METKELLEKYVFEKIANEPQVPDIVLMGMDTISGDVPYRLKLGIVLSELITFASHTRKNIELYDGTLVPVNAIVFAASASGTSKDKALNAIRKALKTGYDQIEKQRGDFAEEKARKKARLDGDGEQSWRKFYVEPNSLQSGLGTVEGLIGHFANVAENTIGAGSVMSSEIGSEIQTNGSITDIVKTIAVAYDLGNIPAKIVKSKDNQTASIKGFPVNALFFGSHEALLFNNEIRAKFRLMFNTQLARRSMFIFTPEPLKPLKITEISQLHELREKERIRVVTACTKLDALTSTLIENTDPTTTLKLDEDATKLFDVYLEYNAILSEEFSNKYPIAKLSQKHKQWLSLKLAGAYAILAGKEEITEKIYAGAIQTVMALSNDLTKFEAELIKEPYEQFVDMCKYNSKDGELFLTIHELRKMSYISGSGSSTPKLEELCTLANSYDAEGIYTSSAEGIRYQKINKSDIVGVSYKIFHTDLKGAELKTYMQDKCSSGFEFFETDFSEIELLLEENAAYGCFAFNNGERSKNNITGSTKFIILDIDESVLTDEEAHILLSEYNHYVVRTSDAENAFKFRILLELDAPLNVDANTWKAFIQEVGDMIGIKVDSLPQSQIFFSFKGRNILKQLEGETLSTKELLDAAAAKVKLKPASTVELTPKVKSEKLNDPRNTFSFAYEAENGQGSRQLYRALSYAVDLGGDAEYVKSLAHAINNYWVAPMDKDRLDLTLITPILRKLGG